MKHLTQSSYQVMPWKNHQGTTSQIKIFPSDSLFSDHQFEWRLSSAEILTSGSFSLFPGYQRLLVIWKGDEIRLNEKNLRPFEPVLFDGSLAIQCQLQSGPVSDLGLIFKADKVKPQINIITTQNSLQLTDGEHFLFCATRFFEVEGTRVCPGECLYISGAKDFKITGPTEARIIQVDIVLIS